MKDRLKWQGESRFVLLSVAVHVAGGALLLAIHPTMPERRSRTITVEVRKREPVPPEPVVTPRPPEEPVAPAPVEPVRPTKWSKKHPLRQPPPPVARPANPPPANPPPATPPPANPPPTGPPARAPGPRIDLFNPNAIALAVPSVNAVTVKPNWGGVTHRLGDGKGDPNVRDSSGDREDAANKVNEFLAEAGSAEKLKSGNVAPRWREAERVAQQSFHPQSALVSDDNALRGFLNQWLHSHPMGGSGGDAPRGFDPTTAGGFNGFGPGGANAQMDITGLNKTRTVVELVVAADGSILSARIVSRSGRRKFDEEALELVRRTGAKGGPLDEKTTVVTKWSVEAWVNVTPPAPSLGFGFEESTGRLSANYPLRKNVQTQVKLISLVARR